MNINSIITKDYRKKDDFVVRINKPNLVRRRRIPKMNVNLYIIEDYENEPLSGPKKTNPNKPNSNPILSAVGGFQNELKISCQKIWPHHPGLSALIYSFRCGIYILRFLVLPHNKLENCYEQAHRFYPVRN